MLMLVVIIFLFMILVVSISIVFFNVMFTSGVSVFVHGHVLVYGHVYAHVNLEVPPNENNTSCTLQRFTEI